MSLERAKLSLSKEIEEMTSRVDQANVLYGHAEKKIKHVFEMDEAESHAFVFAYPRFGWTEAE